MKSLSIVTLLFTMLCTPSCLGQWLKKPTPRVVLTWHDKVNRAAILITDMGLNVIADPPGPLPYSPNASTAIWIGVKFPSDQIAEVVDIGRTYNSELRYVALSDYSIVAPPESTHYEVYIGGDTKTALGLGLKAWTEADFKKLKAAKTQKEIFTLIQSKYGPKPAR